MDKFKSLLAKIFNKIKKIKRTPTTPPSYFTVILNNTISFFLAPSNFVAGIFIYKNSGYGSLMLWIFISIILYLIILLALIMVHFLCYAFMTVGLSMENIEVAWKNYVEKAGNIFNSSAPKRSMVKVKRSAITMKPQDPDNHGSEIKNKTSETEVESKKELKNPSNSTVKHRGQKKSKTKN